MSVYTTVGREELDAWLQPLQLGALVDHAGIAAGMQNSNYFVTTASGRYVLTLFERIDPIALDFYLRLMDHLAGRGVPCPQPLADERGLRARTLAGKPAALLSCLPGRDVEVPTPAHGQAVGAMLARLHRAAADFPDPLPNPCGATWRQTIGEALRPMLPAEDGALLADELSFQAEQDYGALPAGVIHADLFRDNVLWDASGALSGILDFYFAGADALLFDLAVVANDWCFDAASLSGLLAGYQSVRPLEPAENAAWPAMRRAAALRFWLLRLDALHRPRDGEVVTLKDPDHFGNMLRAFRLAQPAPAR